MKSKYAGLAQENGFASAYLQSLQWLVNLQKRVINKIWPLLTVSDWPIIMIGPGGFAISSPPPICCPSFSFMKRVAKNYITKLGCEKYFCWEQIGLRTAGDPLTHAQHCRPSTTTKLTTLTIFFHIRVVTTSKLTIFFHLRVVKTSKLTIFFHPRVLTTSKLTIFFIL
jgi:hypothetical protein